MADIELVIKISEETYKDIQSRDWKNAERWFSEEWKAIHNGTPLPKGHGRLIDADRVIREAIERVKYPANHKYMECVIAHMKHANTIIEADKAESEE